MLQHQGEFDVTDAMPVAILVLFPTYRYLIGNTHISRKKFNLKVIYTVVNSFTYVTKSFTMKTLSITEIFARISRIILQG